MAKYGVMIVNDSGNPFISPSSTPMALHSKHISQSANGVASINIPIDTSLPIIPFVIASKPATGAVTMSVSKQNGYIAASGRNIPGGSFTMSVYVFAIFPQPMPLSKYGIAIWDENGKLILTHETKVLTDLVTVGNRGGNNSGLKLNSTLKGKWAISPEMMGNAIFRVNTGGGPGVVTVSAYTSAIYDGLTTLITSQLTGSGGDLVGTSDLYNSITAVDVSKYD